VRNTDTVRIKQFHCHCPSQKRRRVEEVQPDPPIVAQQISLSFLTLETAYTPIDGLQTVPYQDDGSMTVRCDDCLAFHWRNEQNSNSRGEQSAFTTCCAQGDIVLDAYREPSGFLQTLPSDANHPQCIESPTPIRRGLQLAPALGNILMLQPQRDRQDEWLRFSVGKGAALTRTRHPLEGFSEGRTPLQ
jgi:hypothetical protein